MVGSSPVEETSLPHGHCHRGRDSTLVVHPRENGPSPRICSLLQAMSGRRFDPQTRNRTGQSLQSIPHATPAAAAPDGCVRSGRGSAVSGVPAGSGQLDRLSHRDAPMLPGEPTICSDRSGSAASTIFSRLDLLLQTPNLLGQRAQEEQQPRLPVRGIGADRALRLPQREVVAFLTGLDHTFQRAVRNVA